jgi:hypothetical protein
MVELCFHSSYTSSWRGVVIYESFYPLVKLARGRNVTHSRQNSTVLKLSHDFSSLPSTLLLFRSLSRSSLQRVSAEVQLCPD